MIKKMHVYRFVNLLVHVHKALVLYYGVLKMMLRVYFVKNTPSILAAISLVEFDILMGLRLKKFNVINIQVNL